MINSMIKRLVAIILFIISISNHFAQTEILDGPVNGFWTLENSPFIIRGNIEIPVDSTLTIEPGVVIEFQGHFSLAVKGRLLAVGTESDSILFTIYDTTGFSNADTSLGGWNGIRFIDTPHQNDSSKIVYCKLQYGKAFGSVWHIYAGGAICIVQFDKVLLSNCLITNNKAVSTSDEQPIGGGLYFHKSNIEIKNNTFSNNSAHSGGAVYFDESDPTFSENIFINNLAEEGGAIAIGGTSHPEFNNDKILDNTAGNHGGGLLFAEPTIVIYNNVEINGNKAVWGGGIGVQGGELQANSCKFLNNKADIWGGGVAGDFATLYLNNCMFSQDTSNWGSGGLHMDHATAEIRNCEFIENRAVFGGGFHGVYSQIIFDQTNFISNQADGAAGAHLEASDLEINDCLFQSNNAVVDRAGAIDYIADTTLFNRPNKLKINNCKFLDNLAATNSAGIRIEQLNSESSIIDISIENCEFTDNRSDIYAALRIGGNVSEFKVSNCTFKNNKSKRYVGGAGFISNSHGRVLNSVFAANYSSFSDSSKIAHGASLGSGAEVDFFNCTFIDTSEASGVGISVRRGSKASITNTIIWGCGYNPINIVTAADLGCIVDINYCDIEYGMDSVYVSDSLSILNWGLGNISNDPHFMDEMKLDLHLQDDSPCIGGGINCFIINEDWYCCPTFDIEANSRPNPEGSNADVGAFEHSFGIAVGINYNQVIKSSMFNMCQNYPNPFNPTTVIKYSIPKHSDVTLKVFDVLGSEVATLVNKDQPHGNYEVELNGEDLTSGIYFYRLQAGEFVETRKMILLK